MIEKILNKIKSYSLSLPVIGLTVLLLFAGLLSELFQTPQVKRDPQDFNKKLIQETFFDSPTKIDFSNRFCQLQLETNLLSSHKPWMIVYPKVFPAKSATVNRILDTLKDIKLKRTFINDPINQANFSLDKPVMTIKLDNNKSAPTTLTFGLINPIDNSTYMTMSSDPKVIYQVTGLSSPIETLETSDFLDASVFSLRLSQIDKLVIYRGKAQSKYRSFVLERKDEKWRTNFTRNPSKEKLKKWVDKLSALKSTLIIDKDSGKLEAALTKLKENPYYSIEVADRDGEKLSYTVSKVLKQLPEHTIDSKQHVLVFSSQRKYPYLLNKKVLEILRVSARTVR